MQNTDTQQIIADILAHATDDPLEFAFIKTWDELVYRKQQYAATKLIIKALSTSAEKLFSRYCRELSSHPDISMLLAYKQLVKVKAFYEADLETILLMILEYKQYLGQGHFLYSFFGGVRKF